VNNTQRRIFIGNSLTPTNQLIYKQLRDLKKQGFINKISFFDGIFAVHQQGKYEATKIHHTDQLKLLTTSHHHQHFTKLREMSMVSINKLQPNH
jgi:DNA-binding PadR family transcriptional regulator